jgi:hypothetical protein
MNRVARFSLLAALGLLLAAPTHADEILFFTNGTTMAIKSHLIKEGMIHVDLGSKASMAFPSTMVDRIELSGRPVYAGGKPANQRVAGGGMGSMEQDGRMSVPSAYRAGNHGQMPAVGSADGGDSPSAEAVVSPVSGRLQSAMNPTGQAAPQGMQRIGNRVAFTPPNLGQPASGSVTGISKRAMPLAAPAPPDASGDVVTPPDLNPPDELPQVGHPEEDDEGDDEDAPE